MPKHAPPDYLGPQEAEFYSEIAREFGITDAQGLATLRLAAETLQRLRQAREIIDNDGIVTDGRPHPLLLCERDQKKGFLSLMNALGLDTEAPQQVGRPVTSVRRVA
jgi:hypothetical protein